MKSNKFLICVISSLFLVIVVSQVIVGASSPRTILEDDIIWLMRYGVELNCECSAKDRIALANGERFTHSIVIIDTNACLEANFPYVREQMPWWRCDESIKFMLTDRFPNYCTEEAYIECHSCHLFY